MSSLRFALLAFISLFIQISSASSYGINSMAYYDTFEEFSMDGMDFPEWSVADAKIRLRDAKRSMILGRRLLESSEESSDNASNDSEDIFSAQFDESADQAEEDSIENVDHSRHADEYAEVSADNVDESADTDSADASTDNSEDSLENLESADNTEDSADYSDLSADNVDESVDTDSVDASTDNTEDSIENLESADNTEDSADYGDNVSESADTDSADASTDNAEDSIENLESVDSAENDSVDASVEDSVDSADFDQSGLEDSTENTDEADASADQAEDSADNVDQSSEGDSVDADVVDESAEKDSNDASAEQVEDSTDSSIDSAENDNDSRENAEASREDSADNSSDSDDNDVETDSTTEEVLFDNDYSEVISFFGGEVEVFLLECTKSVRTIRSSCACDSVIADTNTQKLSVTMKGRPEPLAAVVSECRQSGLNLSNFQLTAYNNICDGSYGSHDCVCEDSHTKVATHAPVVFGRRRAAIMGETAYCRGENTCMYEEETTMVGPLSIFHHCVHLESWERYEVTSYFPTDGDEMPEDASDKPCLEFMFHCEDDRANVDVPNCGGCGNRGNAESSAFRIFSTAAMFTALLGWF